MLTPAEFTAMHRPGAPLLLPNAWDLASARWLIAAGHPVVGTTSLGVAVAAGRADGAGETAVETLDLAERLTRAGITVTVDIEAGFSGDPGAIGEFAARLAALGVVGVNIEDSDGSGSLIDADLAAASVAAIADAAPDLYLNARTDTFWLDGLAPASTRLDEAVRRAHRYLAAGASGIFVPGMLSLELVAALSRDVPAPLNVLVQPGVPVAALAHAGVARVSTGSLLFRLALGAIATAADELRHGNFAPPATTPSYEDVVALS
jgi:2-methylisocitrate lyase-like PEP mutase family enzyme